MNLFILTAIIFGSICQIEAGVLDDFGNTFVNREAVVPVRNLNSLYQGGENDADLSTDFKNINDRSYNRNSWQNLLTNRRKPYTNVFPQIATPKVNEDVTPEVAERFPTSVKLLNKLRELNKLKAEDKLSFDENQSRENSDNNKYSKYNGHDPDYDKNRNEKPNDSNKKFGSNILIGNLTNAMKFNKYPPNPATIGSNEDVDPEIAKLFPAGVKLLNILKELNRLKKEGKLSFGGNKTASENINNKVPDKKGKDDPKNDNNGRDDPKNSGNGTNSFNYIKDPNMYFQAQPVIPENERKENNVTIYHSK